MDTAVATAMVAAVEAAVAEDTAAADTEVVAAATAAVVDTVAADTKAPPSSAHIRHLH